MNTIGGAMSGGRDGERAEAAPGDPVTLVEPRAESASASETATGTTGEFGSRGARNLRKRATRATGWVLGGEAAGQVLRFGSNLILTRLLTPQVFGVMMLLMSFVQLLEMLSDVGLRASLTQNRRGDDPDFFNTVWTLQVIRGGLLWLATLLLAWPVAIIYQDDSLALLLSVVGARSVIAGFQSAVFLRLNRHLDLKPYTIINFVVQIVRVGGVVAWALVWPNIWALIFGTLASAAVQVAITWIFLPGDHGRFRWERDAVREVFAFGKWIFASSLLDHFAKRGDRFIVPFVFPSMAVVGVYGLALHIADVVTKILGRLNRRVVFPVYTRISDDSPEELRRKSSRVRWRLSLLALPPLCALAILGDQIFCFLYEPDYWSGGPMLRALAIAGVATVISSTSQPILLAKGDSFSHFMTNLVLCIITVIGMVAAWYSIQGTEIGAILGPGCGILPVYGIALSRVAAYFVISSFVARYSMWTPRLDFAMFAIAGIVIALGTFIVG